MDLDFSDQRTNREKDLALKSALDQERTSWLPVWRQLAQYIAPYRLRELLTDTNKGDRRDEFVVDNTATLAWRTLRAGMSSGVTNPARPWFRVSTADPALAKRWAVKDWLYYVQELLYQTFQRSNFYSAMQVGYGDIGGFGTMVHVLDEDAEDTIRLYTIAPGSYWLGTSARQEVDTLVRQTRMTVKQVVDKFGNRDAPPSQRWANFSHSTRAAYAAGNYQQAVDVLHVIQPNATMDLSRLPAKFKPFASRYHEIGSEGDRPLRESGYDTFPVLAARWDLIGEDAYGRGPGHDALGDTMALQILQKRKAQATEKNVRPPMQAPTSLAKSGINTGPDEVTFVDVRDGQQGVRSIYEGRISLPDMIMDIQDHRERIRGALYENLFLMMQQSDRREITATEIDERREEKLLALGPVLERLNDEEYDRAIERTFSILVRRNMIPPPPAELRGQPLRIEYISIMAQAQRMVGLAGVDRVLQIAGNLVSVFPDVRYKVNANRTLEIYGDMNGIPPDILRSDKEVAAMQAKDAQQQAAIAQVDAAAKMAQSAKVLSETDVTGQNALTQYLGGGA